MSLYLNFYVAGSFLGFVLGEIDDFVTLVFLLCGKVALFPRRYLI